MIRHPRANKTAYVFSALCGTFLFLTYAAFYSLTALHQPSHRVHYLTR